MVAIWYTSSAERTSRTAYLFSERYYISGHEVFVDAPTDLQKDIIFNQYRIKIHPILDLQSCAAVSEFCETKSLTHEAARLKALQKVPFVHEAYDWDADLEVTSTACEYARREPITLLTATPTLISGFKISGDIDITVGTAKSDKKTIWQQIQMDIDTARSRSSASNVRNVVVCLRIFA